MPYILKKDRKRLQEVLRSIQREVPKNSGELNYLISNICLAYINEHGLAYKNINDIMGALDCVSRELYRRVVASYENKKIKENGDL